MKEGIEPLRDLRKLHSLSLEDLSEEGVAVDVLAFLGVLKRESCVYFRGYLNDQGSV